MIPMIIFVLVCAIFVVLIRRRRRVLSSIIAIEAAVLTMLFFSLSLSAFGVPFMQAFTDKVSFMGLHLSSLTLIIAALFIMTVFVALSALIHIVKKFRQSKKQLRQYCREHYETFKTSVFSVFGRRLLLLHCRLND